MSHKKGKTPQNQNIEMKLHQSCRIEHQQIVTEHVMACADWLITFQRIAPKKILKMWSVLNLDAELDKLKVEKILRMKLFQEKKTMTPVKTPKTRNQKKIHTKLTSEAYDEEPGTSGVTESEMLNMIEDQSKTAAIHDTVRTKLKLERTRNLIWV